MKNSKFYTGTLLVSIFFSLLMSPAGGFTQDADQLLEKMDKVLFSASDKQGKVEIILENKKGREKSKEADMYQKGPDMRLYRYTQPESQAGIATLSLPGGEMWMYMPALGKPKKISLMAKTGAFNNTDFSWEDMAMSPYSERYDPEFLDSTPDAWMLELVPKDDNSEYSKIVVTQHKQHYYPMKMEYYDKRGEKIKEAVYQYEKVGKYWNASEVVMTDLRKDHSTRILVNNVKFDQGLTDELFKVENLPTEKE